MRSTLPLMPVLAMLTAALLLSGCLLDGSMADSELVSENHHVQIHRTVFSGIPQEVTPDPIYLLAPAELSVYVGEDVELDLLLTEPGNTQLRAVDIPGTSQFVATADGGHFSWTPQLNHVGTHSIRFEVCDRVTPSIVLDTPEIDLSVLPRFGLIEYGF